MKQIKSISIWDNGQTYQGNKFQCYSTFDNFQNSATLYYAIFEDNKMLTSGNLQLNGAEYEAWDSNPSANEWAYNWAAQQLNLTIEGDWVEPVVEHTAKDEEFINSVLEQLPDDVVNDLTGETAPEETEK